MPVNPFNPLMQAPPPIQQTDAPPQQGGQAAMARPVYFDADHNGDYAAQLNQFADKGHLKPCVDQFKRTIDSIVEFLQNQQPPTANPSTFALAIDSQCKAWEQFKNRLQAIVNNSHAQGPINVATLLGPVKRMMEQIAQYRDGNHIQQNTLRIELSNIAERLNQCSTGIQSDCQDALRSLEADLVGTYQKLRRETARSIVQETCKTWHANDPYHAGNEIHTINIFLAGMPNLGGEPIPDHYATPPTEQEMRAMEKLVTEGLANGAALRLMAQQAHDNFCAKLQECGTAYKKLINKRVFDDSIFQDIPDFTNTVKELAEQVNVENHYPTPSGWDFFEFDGEHYCLPKHATGRVIEQYKAELIKIGPPDGDLTLSPVGTFRQLKPGDSGAHSTYHVFRNGDSWWTVLDKADDMTSNRAVASLTTDALTCWIDQTQQVEDLYQLIPVIDKMVAIDPHNKQLYRKLFDRYRAPSEASYPFRSTPQIVDRRLRITAQGWMAVCLQIQSDGGLKFLVDSLSTADWSHVLFEQPDSRIVETFSLLRQQSPAIFQHLVQTLHQDHQKNLLRHAIVHQSETVVQGLIDLGLDHELLFHESKPMLYAICCGAYEIARLLAHDPIRLWNLYRHQNELMQFAYSLFEGLKDPASSHLVVHYRALRALQAEALRSSACREQLLSMLEKHGDVSTAQPAVYALFATELLLSLNETPHDNTIAEFYRSAVKAINPEFIDEHAHLFPLLQLAYQNGLAIVDGANAETLQQKLYMAVDWYMTPSMKIYLQNFSAHTLVACNLLQRHPALAPGKRVTNANLLDCLYKYLGDGTPTCRARFEVAPHFMLLRRMLKMMPNCIQLQEAIRASYQLTRQLLPDNPIELLDAEPEHLVTEAEGHGP